MRRRSTHDQAAETIVIDRDAEKVRRAINETRKFYYKTGGHCCSVVLLKKYWVSKMLRSIILATTAAVIVSSDVAIAKDVIHVSCYRGPWDDVIWDRANPEFVESLQSFGYNQVDAENLANSICRDARLVYNPDKLADQVRKVVLDAPGS